MGNNAINTFRMILDESDNIIKNIRLDIFKTLDLGTYEQLNDYVRETLNHFAFNNTEIEFFRQIRDAVNEEMDKGTLKIKTNETIDYSEFTNNLIHSLRSLKKVAINLDDDLRKLARDINDKFPLIASDDWYARLNSKREQIVALINGYNENVIETLITLSPRLAKELSDLDAKTKLGLNKETNLQQPSQAQPLKAQVMPEKRDEQSSTYLSIDDFYGKCMDRFAELELIFQNGGNDKSEIAKVYRKFKHFIDSLNDKAYAKTLLDKYKEVGDYAISMIYDRIMFENVPMLNDILQRKKQVNVELSREGNTPNGTNPTESVSNYVGATNEDIIALIQQKKYFSLLHGIKKDDVIKYNSFISTGYNIMIGEWYRKAPNCKTYDEKHAAYFELYEIYQNFRDYISLEQSNQLRELLNNINKYLQEHRAKPEEKVGIRYNSSDNSDRMSNSNMMR